GDRRRRLAGTQGVFAVIRDFKPRGVDSAESMDQRRERTVAFAGKGHQSAITQQPGAAGDDSVFAFSLKTLQLPGGSALDIFLPKHRFEFGPAHLPANPVHRLVRDRPEFALHLLWQLNAKFAFQQVGDTALAGLGIDANDFAVLAANVPRIDGQIGNVPMLALLLLPFGQAFFNRVLV